MSNQKESLSMSLEKLNYKRQSKVVKKINEIIEQLNHISQDISRLYANDHINELSVEALNAEKAERCPEGEYYCKDCGWVKMKDGLCKHIGKLSTSGEDK
jgi:hypothetical protein